MEYRATHRIQRRNGVRRGSRIGTRDISRAFTLKFIMIDSNIIACLWRHNRYRQIGYVVSSVMTVMGQKRTSAFFVGMSAFEGKAVVSGPKTDIVA